ncbi:hypothetical protein N7495_004959 [Penicillium taxi]|uniref:uncharacterized protein n=1 Tax=Penicillium taxi TaxID=168475 RepID=UPI002545A099|nr:uncharacterized protein N7495_004959 [Penicillium taxi]KAJ5893268.1 hypothetical protein N7495_004959 [Penicillium taxi]
MSPATPADLLNQHSRSLEDHPTFNLDQTRTPQENEPVGKSKKKKGKKAKGTRTTTETPDDLNQPVPQAEPSSCPDPSLEHHVQPTVTMDILGTMEHERDNDLAARTDTWAQAVPYGKSPPIDLMDEDLPQEAQINFSAREEARGNDSWSQDTAGVERAKSPPTNHLMDGVIPHDSAIDVPTKAHAVGVLNHPSPDSPPINFPKIQARGGFSPPSSASPPSRVRPFSYGSGFRSTLNSRQQSVDWRKSHSYGSPMGNNMPPPPHLPQAHFYEAPDIDLQGHTVKDGSYSFYGFDTLPSMTAKTPRAGMNVLVVGMDGAVEIQAIEDHQTRLVGQITGLGGRVLEAKILANHFANDAPGSSQPHVAITIHGPLAPNEEEAPSSPVISEFNDAPPSATGGRSRDSRLVRDNLLSYQTRVEVYSLRSGEHIETLFMSNPVSSMENILGMPSLAPPPVGSLKIYNSGHHVVVASGVSGEVYIYRQTPSSGYECLGKTWTNIQVGESRRYSTSSSSTDPEGSHHDLPHHSILDRPILSVQGRWLAIVPPSSSTRRSIQGTVPAHIMHSRAQGIESRGPPTVPSVNCVTDVGEGESLFDKVARGVTQELVKGARWMGDQGLQAWNSYWNSQQAPPGAPPLRPARTETGLFPPTHGQETQSLSTEPDAVSIIDLKPFDDNTDMKAMSLNPVGTFQVPNGCSFLSISPSGLMLFTASTKGDVQYVWDLMQLKYCRAMAFMTDDQVSKSPNVRQVARYARLTASNIVDVIWTAPTGDRLAVITRKGTIHVFDLPGSAFQCPPFRRARPATKRAPSVDPAGDEMSTQSTSGNPLSAAMKLVGGKTQPFFSVVRGRVPASGTAFPNMSGLALTSAAGIKGGKVVAAGLSKSMGAAASGTVHTLRHVGENRLHLTGLARDPAPARVIWIISKGQMHLGVADGGQIKLYCLKRGPVSHKSRQFHTVIGEKVTQYRLPANLQSICGSAPLVPYNQDLTRQAYLLLPSVSAQSSSPSKPFCQPLSKAEIETNTPYQPFHTDQRVGLHVYSTDNSVGEQWVFGNDIPTTKVHVRSYNNTGDDLDDECDDNAVHGHSFGAGGDMENLISLTNSTGNVEEVVITTRRKKKHTPLKADDGFFEDDCEVLDFARDRV